MSFWTLSLTSFLRKSIRNNNNKDKDKDNNSSGETHRHPGRTITRNDGPVYAPHFVLHRLIPPALTPLFIAAQRHNPNGRDCEPGPAIFINEPRGPAPSFGSSHLISLTAAPRHKTVVTADLLVYAHLVRFQSVFLFRHRDCGRPSRNASPRLASPRHESPPGLEVQAPQRREVFVAVCLSICLSAFLSSSQTATPWRVATGRGAFDWDERRCLRPPRRSASDAANGEGVAGSASVACPLKPIMIYDRDQVALQWPASGR